MEKKNNKHKKEEKEIKKEHCNKEECNCKEAKEECACDEECNCNDECNCNEECSCSDNKELEDKIKNLEEALLRSQAELINYKRRKDEETNRIIKYAEEDILKGFLPILDNFERAISMDDDNLEDEVSKFLEGFKLMYKQIKDLLEKFEVKEIDCLGKEFDPSLEQAVVVDHDETKESGVVTVVLQKGYMYKDRVLRTAMVKVNE